MLMKYELVEHLMSAFNQGCGMGFYRYTYLEPHNNLKVQATGSDILYEVFLHLIKGFTSIL